MANTLCLRFIYTSVISWEFVEVKGVLGTDDIMERESRNIYLYKICLCKVFFVFLYKITPLQKVQENNTAK
jgi:hypothetical protein